MAMTGGTAKLVKTGTLNYGNTNATVQLYVYYKTSQDQNTNKSTITCGMYITTTSGYDIGPWSDYNGSYVGTTSNTFDGSITSKISGTKWLVENKSFTVSHNDDGTGKATIYWRWGVNSPWGQMVNPSGSFTITLPTIPRASTIDSLSCNTSYFTGTLTYKYTPQSANYYNQCNISLNINGTFNAIRSINIGKNTAVQQTGTVTLSTSELQTIYNKLPKAQSGILRFTFRTYSDASYTNQVGGGGYKEITLSIPTTIVPNLGTVTLSPTKITTADNVSRTILVQNSNTVLFSASGSAAGTGSTISSYKFEVLSGTTVIETKTTTSASVTMGPFSKTGTLTFRLTVTDARGRSTTNKGSEPSLTCYAYNPPSFSSFTAYRCNSSGTADENGEYVKYSLGVNYSSIKSGTTETNNSTVKIFYKKSNSSTWTSAANALTNSTTKTASAIIKNSSGVSVAFTLDSTYSIYATVTDNYKGVVSSSIVTIFSATRIFNIRQSGNGIAFGKLAESDNLLESKWPAKFDNGLTVGSSTQNSAPSSGIAIHDVRNVDITPDSFGDKNANFYFYQGSNNKWQSILHMKGWTGNYAAWELSGNAHSSSDDNSLKYRQGIGDTWGDWQTVLTDKNVKNYANVANYLPLAGGTLTGKLTLVNDLYYTANGLAGLDCQNSDIINANGIYFRDASDTAGETINFYRSAETWDTLYAYNGELRFHPNRVTNSAANGYRVFHGGNLEFRSGHCTLSSSSSTTITFSSAMSKTPIVMLTPYTSSSGVISAKITNVTTTGFSAIIGGSSVSSAEFMYFAIYY